MFAGDKADAIVGDTERDALVGRRHCHADRARAGMAEGIGECLLRDPERAQRNLRAQRVDVLLR